MRHFWSLHEFAFVLETETVGCTLQQAHRTTADIVALKSMLNDSLFAGGSGQQMFSIWGCNTEVSAATKESVYRYWCDGRKDNLPDPMENALMRQYVQWRNSAGPQIVLSCAEAIYFTFYGNCRRTCPARLLFLLKRYKIDTASQAFGSQLALITEGDEAFKEFAFVATLIAAMAGVRKPSRKNTSNEIDTRLSYWRTRRHRHVQKGNIPEAVHLYRALQRFRRHINSNYEVQFLDPTIRPTKIRKTSYTVIAPANKIMQMFREHQREYISETAEQLFDRYEAVFYHYFISLLTDDKGTSLSLMGGELGLNNGGSIMLFPHTKKQEL